MRGRMVEFYPDGESHLRSEKLDLKWSESLVAKIGYCVCGNCRRIVHGAESLTACPLPDCGAAWKQVVYVESITTFRHQRLGMFGKTVLGKVSPAPTRASKHSLPFIQRRMVQDNDVNTDLL